MAKKTTAMRPGKNFRLTLILCCALVWTFAHPLAAQEEKKAATDHSYQPIVLKLNEEGSKYLAPGMGDDQQPRRGGQPPAIVDLHPAFPFSGFCAGLSAFSHPGSLGLKWIDQ